MLLNYLPNPQINHYVNDPMHSIDSGIGKYGFYQAIRVGYDNEKDRWKFIRPHLPKPELSKFTAVVNDAFAVFRKCLPGDFVRQPRNPFEAAQDYKTAEVRLAATRFMPALLQLPRFADFKDGGLTKNYMNLVIYCRLVNHFSTKPIPVVSTFNPSHR
jgi:hypothetical protein